MPWDWPTSEEHASFGGGLQQSEEPKHGRFPGPVRPDDGQNLALLDVKRRDIQDQRPAVCDLHPFKGEDRRGQDALPRCWIHVSAQFTAKVRSNKRRLSAIAISKFPLLVSRTVAVVRTRVCR